MRGELPVRGGNPDLLVSGFVGDWGRSWSGSMVYILLTYVRQNEPNSGPKNGILDADAGKADLMSSTSLTFGPRPNSV